MYIFNIILDNPEDYGSEALGLEKAQSLKLTKTSSTIGKISEAKKMMEKVVSDVKEFTFLSFDSIIIILTQYCWNRFKFEDKWYDDPESFKIKSGLEYDKKLKLKPTSIKFCDVCGDKNDNNFFGLSCGHKFCKLCWKEYLEFKVADKLTSISTTCMLKGCNLIVPYTVFKDFVSADQLAHYDEALLRSFTETNPDIKWCPYPKCGRFFKSSKHTARNIICDCKGVYCFKCQRDGHQPCSCELMQAWDKKNNSDGENDLWLKANTKQCPKCHKHIEKNQGCNHMQCRKEVQGCGFHFCWICLGEWVNHGDLL